MEVTESKDFGGNPPAETRLPRVAIVGRPNVGKSTLFNRLVGKRRALVHDLPGMTRDRLIATAEWGGHWFEISDTGGIDDQAGLSEQVGRQALGAAGEADLVVLVVDGRAGLVPADNEVLLKLFRAGAKSILLAVNKIDTPGLRSELADFASLGIEGLFGVSAETGAGLPELLDEVVHRLPAATPGAEPEALSVALVGRPNVGKSTLFNALVGTPRSVVSEVPGTTRDTVDVVVDHDGLRIRWLDTAGIRRPGRTERGPEVLSVVQARKTIARAEVVVLVLDATESIAHQDAVVAGLADDARRPIVFAWNKWDLIGEPDARRRELERQTEERLKFLPGSPRVTTSGKTTRGIQQLLLAIRDLDRRGRTRVPTHALNRFVSKQLQVVSLPAKGAQEAHILFATQIGTRPPSFVFFVNRRIAVHFSTHRRILNLLREAFDLGGLPIKIRFRERGSR